MSDPFAILRHGRSRSDLALDEEMLCSAGHHDAAGTPADRARLAELAAERERFALRSPWRVAAQPKRRTGWLSAALLATGAAAATILMTVVPDQGVRSKGNGPVLGLWIEHNGVVRHGEDGQTVHPGDRLRFDVTSSTTVHVAVLSRDGAGVVSVYAPATQTSEMLTVAGGEQIPLPLATRLDEVIGTEQIISIFCTAPISVALLREHFAQLQASPPTGCTTSLLRLEKRPAP